jgi:putative oxidoreductase
METINIADKLIPARPTVYSFLRIITGLIILIRGFNFIFVIATLRSMIQADVAVFAENSATLSFIIAVLDIACGLFITVGFVTRISAIIQIPILFVAAFLVNIRHIGENSFEFILSLVTFFLVIMVAYKGSGPFSADEYFKRGAALDKRGENRM